MLICNETWANGFPSFEQNGHRRNVEVMSHQTFTCKGFNDIYRHSCGFSSIQIQNLCLLTALSRWKWASSVHKMFYGHSFWISHCVRNWNAKFCWLLWLASMNPWNRDKSITNFEEFYEPWIEVDSALCRTQLLSMKRDILSSFICVPTSSTTCASQC